MLFQGSRQEYAEPSESIVEYLDPILNEPTPKKIWFYLLLNVSMVYDS